MLILELFTFYTLQKRDRSWLDNPGHYNYLVVMNSVQFILKFEYIIMTVFYILRPEVDMTLRSIYFTSPTT